MKTIVVKLREFLSLLIILNRNSIKFDYHLGSKSRVMVTMKLADAQSLGF